MSTIVNNTNTLRYEWTGKYVRHKYWWVNLWRWMTNTKVKEYKEVKLPVVIERVNANIKRNWSGRPVNFPSIYKGTKQNHTDTFRSDEEHERRRRMQDETFWPSWSSDSTSSDSGSSSSTGFSGFGGGGGEGGGASGSWESHSSDSHSSYDSGSYDSGGYDSGGDCGSSGGD